MFNDIYINEYDDGFDIQLWRGEDAVSACCSEGIWDVESLVGEHIYSGWSGEDAGNAVLDYFNLVH